MTTPNPTAPPVVLDPERLLGFESLAGETDDARDWPKTLADLHNKIGIEGGEVPPGTPPG